MKVHLDTSGIKKLKSKLRSLSNKKVDWGYPEGAGEYSTADMPYAELASMLEWGVRGRIPPRPALRESIEDLQVNRKDFENNIEPYIKDFLISETGSADKVANKSGEYLKESYQHKMEFWYIEGSQNKHNAPLTKALKGHDRPYIDTGELIKNATFNVK